MHFVLTKEMLIEAGISDAVLEAGTGAFFDYDSRFEGAEEVVFRIYTAMKKAETSLSPEDSNA